MKKVLFILFVSLTICTVRLKAQPNTDTLAILQTIVNNKANYIGQPFSVLLNQLPIHIKHFLPLPNEQNRNFERITSFGFYYPSNPSQTYRSYPRLNIYWQQNLDRRQSRYLYYPANGAWSQATTTFYGNAIIADIQILR